MEIKNLQYTTIETIYTAFQKAFINYFVPFTTTLEETKTRWERANVDLNFSYGAFDNGILAAFVLNSRTPTSLYNFSVGVIPEYRGKHLIEEIYRRLPSEFSQYVLEVITENEKAIGLYTKLGYKKARLLHSFEGAFKIIEHKRYIQYEIRDHYENDELRSIRLHLPSTESSFEVIHKNKNKFETHEVRSNGELLAYAQYNPESLSLKEIGSKVPLDENLDLLFHEMKLTDEKIRIMNIDAESIELISYLERRGLVRFISQYEMIKTI